MMPSGRASLDRETKAHSPGTLIFWAIVAVIVFTGFIALGNWQVRRLSWKLHLIAEVSTRVHAPTMAAPGPPRWAQIAAGHGQYLHVHLTGKFLNRDETLVRGTSRLGYGYWVMTPMRTLRGFIVLVNRGYIPSSLPDTAGISAITPPRRTVTITGLLRLTEPHGGLFRPNRPNKQLWYSRDVDAITTALRLPHKNVAPYFVDAAAQSGGQRWPAGGLTVIQFRNHHLGYAITWYALAAMVVAGSAIGIRFEWLLRH